MGTLLVPVYEIALRFMSIRPYNVRGGQARDLHASVAKLALRR